MKEKKDLSPGRDASRVFVPQVAVPDTAFHAASMAPVAYSYALPADLTEELGVRRYGFHGTSYAYVSKKLAAALGKPPASLNAIICHLGSGASMCAVENGKSVDTTMGLTPLEGLARAPRGDGAPAGRRPRGRCADRRRRSWARARATSTPASSRTSSGTATTRRPSTRYSTRNRGSWAYRASRRTCARSRRPRTPATRERSSRATSSSNGCASTRSGVASRRFNGRGAARDDAAATDRSQVLGRIRGQARRPRRRDRVLRRDRGRRRGR